MIWVIVLNIQVARLQNEVSSLNERLVAQSESIDQIIANLPQTDQADVITVSLKGTQVQPQAQGQLIVDPDSQSAVLVISGLPKLEPGNTYQVWLINGGAPISAGLLAVDENGQGVFIVNSEEAIGSFNSLGISVEPEGGSEQPTGDIVVLSDL
jgi:anti-sigma-K factor RskA